MGSRHAPTTSDGLVFRRSSEGPRVSGAIEPDRAYRERADETTVSLGKSRLARSAANSIAGGRFILDDRVGVGGMGSVYRAFDTKKSTYVAVKSLGRIDAETVRSFKAEFRGFQHLSHPNLVALDELFSEGDDWYFTMELIAGEEILSHVRHMAGGVERLVGGVTANTIVREVVTRTVGKEASGALPATPTSGESSAEAGPRAVRYPGVFDEARFRPALQQLTAGLHHLHKAGKVHCDVKSYNILVCPDGRTVLLDFGIAVDARANTTLRAATPLYMAPELLLEPATPAADWYAVGVLIYTALTGMDPFEGDFAALIESKRALPPHPRTLVPDAALDLGDLALGLMRPDPHQRLGRRAILEYLESATASPGVVRSVEPPPDEDDLFIGRRDELRFLRAAYDDLATSDGPVVVYVQGESGIGKSALVKELADGLELLRRGRITILRARVFEDEVVPYKSVDGIVDALVEWFRSLPDGELDALLPEAFGAVADTFPVLRSLARVARLPRSTTPDPLERRAQMFGALKECFRRVAERGPLVVTVDDFQWSDDDSLLLWNDLLRSPGAPRFLLIATMRGERMDSRKPSHLSFGSWNPRMAERAPSLPIPTETLWMRPLSEQESRAYVEARLLSMGSLRLDMQNAEDVIAEANGHPLFLDELLRYKGNLGTGKLDLDRVLCERIIGLDGDMRRYLELVCIAAKPLPRTLVGTAAGLSHGDGLRALKALRAQRLVKTTRTPGIDGEDWVDPFHFRIRDACLASLDPVGHSERHRSIADAMEAEGKLDAEQLAVHFRCAGDVKKAAHYAEIAGHVAFEATGFRKAAEFFADSIELSGTDVRRVRRLRERLAISFRNAGMGKAAADELLALADDEDSKSFERRCEAAELLLRSGHVDEGYRVVERVLVDAGETVPTNDRRAWLALIYRSIRLRMRGTSWRPRAEGALSPRVLRSIDALWCFSVGLGPIDQMRAYACAAEHSLRALDAGEPVRVAKAFAMETLTAAAQGNGPLAEQHAEEARRILATVGDAASSLAIVPASNALSLMMAGKWPEALAASVSAQAWIRAKTAGAWGELAFAEEAELWSLAYTGDFVGLVERQQSVVQRAHEQQDLYAGFAARSGLSNLAYLAADAPARALSETRNALALWSTRGVHLQHIFDTFARAQAHLYAGDLEEAADALTKMEAQRQGRRILVPEPLTSLLADLEGRIGLARSFSKNASVAHVRVAARNLERCKNPWIRGVRLLLDAGVAHASRDLPTAADLASSAGLHLRRHGMTYLAQLAAIYTRQLEGNGQHASGLPVGRHRVRNPVAFARTFVPGLFAR